MQALNGILVKLGLKKAPPRDEPAEGEEEAIVINITDSAAVKICLDEHAVKYVTDTSQYKEDMYWRNLKLVLGYVAVAVALLAQFYPQEFPASRFALGVCVSIYYVFHSTLWLITVYVDQDIIVITKPKPAKHKGVDIPAFNLRTQQERYETDYSLSVDLRGPRPTAKGKSVHEATLQVTDFFDVDGVFLAPRFEEQMRAFVEAFEAKCGKASQKAE